MHGAKYMGLFTKDGKNTEKSQGSSETSYSLETKFVSMLYHLWHMVARRAPFTFNSLHVASHAATDRQTEAGRRQADRQTDTDVETFKSPHLPVALRSHASHHHTDSWQHTMRSAAHALAWGSWKLQRGTMRCS